MNQKNKTQPSSPRGIALLIAVIFASIALSIGLSLAALSSDQLSLSTTIKRAQVAFNAADSIMECLHYEEQKNDRFNYPHSLQSHYVDPFVCAGSSDETSVQYLSLSSNQEGVYSYTYSSYFDQESEWFPVASGGCAKFSLVKTEMDPNIPLYNVQFYVTGASSCDFSKPEQVVERTTYLEYTRVN
jgi:hypothetical protein